VPLFRRSRPSDEPRVAAALADAAAAGAAPPAPEATRELERIAALPLTELAAQVMAVVADQTAPFGSDSERHESVSISEVVDAYCAARTIALPPGSHRYFREAMWTLAVARLVAPDRNRLGPAPDYAPTRDGLAALQRGDVAEILARRLRD
jgi:hypothetical protein